MHTIKKAWFYIQKLPRLYSVSGAVVVVALVAIGVHVITRPAATAELAPTVTHVQISSVASLSSQAGPLPVTGKVTSLNDATILAQSSGEIVSLSHVLGAHVSAGSVIATFDSSSQQAAVQQAQGAYAAAQAALAKASGSTAQNSSVTSAQATQGAQNASTAANAALRSAYAGLDDAVHTKADALMSNPHSPTPQLNFISSNSQLPINIQNARIALDPLLEGISVLGSDPVSTSVDTDITTMIAKAQTVETFLNDLVEALNKAIPTTNVPASTIAGYQTSIAAARTEVIAAVSALTTAKSAYDSAISGATTAANSASGGTASDIAAAEANVQQALGALNGAKANLEKSIVRSPISGTIVSLAVTRGDYVSSFSKVAEVSNPSALEIDTYVTPADAKTLSVGAKALIEGTVSGTIVSIAPALDPTTNKIQVKVGITGDSSELTDGETVTVALTRSTNTVAGTKKTGNKSNTAILIPIVAAKITPTGPVVFSVSSSTLVASPITLGAVVGDQVTVTTGLTPVMDIVTDARGLVSGQQVVVDTK